MSSTSPNLTQGPVPLALIRSEARRHIFTAIDSRRGKKLLVLDPKVSAYLGVLTEITLLREHGVERLLHLEGETLGEVGVRSVVYFVRPTVANAQLIAAQVKDLNRGDAKHDVSVFFIPQRSLLCERLLKAEGVWGDLAIADIPVHWIPYDTDVLSLELDGVFREQACDGDYSSLYGIAAALEQLQQTYGHAARLVGKGVAACQLRPMLVRARAEAALESGGRAPLPPPGARAVHSLVVLDRAVDLLSPACTQLTYEGLIDEVFGVTNGAVMLDPAKKQRTMLNSSDRLFAELRDASFAAVGPRLGEKAKLIQSSYQGSKAQERTMAELKEFAGELKELPHITRHIGLAEELSRRCAQQRFRDRIAAEQSLLDGVALDATCESIEELICSGEALPVVLRLLVLVTLAAGGVPKRYYDSLRREVLHTYGHEHISTLTRLQEAGLIRRQEGSRSGFSTLKKAFRLLVEGSDDKPPDDIAYTYSGYAPLSVRLVEQALKVPGGGWGPVEDVLKLLPGGHYDVPFGAPDDEAGTTHAAPTASSKRLVIVVFVGGVTFAEMAALRYLGRQPTINTDFLIATTKIVSGNSLVTSCMDPAVAAGVASMLLA